MNHSTTAPGQIANDGSFYARADGKQLSDDVALRGALLPEVSFGECPGADDCVWDDTSATR